jgi:uncharacterized protein (TIGR02996 family)
MNGPPAIPAEQEALLQAVVAEPEDDTPRLVYADWLQENGEERQAVFIRESIDLARSDAHTDAARETLARRLEITAEANGRVWLAALGVTRCELQFDRGFAEWVGYLTPDAFFAERSVLFSRVPVRDLSVYGEPGEELDDRSINELAAAPELARLDTLRLSNCGESLITVESWERLIRSPHLTGLRSLSVTWAGLTDEYARALAGCPNLSGLEELGLGGNLLTAEGALAVVRSPYLARVARLGLAHNSIVEDRSRGSPYRALLTALVDRFDGVNALQADL